MASVVTIVDSVIQGGSYGLWFKQPAGRCQLRNVLLTAEAAGIRFDVPSPQAALIKLEMDRVTQTQGRSMMDISLESAETENLRVDITCGESVFAPTTGLVRIAGPVDWPRSNARVEFLLPERGNPTIVAPDVLPAVFLDRSLKSLVALDQKQLTVESLLIAVPTFRSVDLTTSANTEVSGFELLDYEGPKLSPVLPGVDISRLPKTELTE